MNRRNFIGAALRAAAGFAILPSAATYVRAWKPTPRRIPTPPEAWDMRMFSIVTDPETGLTFQKHEINIGGKSFAILNVMHGIDTSLRTPFYRDYLRAASPAT